MSIKKYTKRFLVVLAQEHLNFRIPELESVLSLNQIVLDEVWENKSASIKNPFVILKGINEAKLIETLSRTVLARNGYELWGEGKNYDELKDSLKNFPQKDVYFAKSNSFCLRVKGFGRKIPIKEQLKKIDSLEDVLTFEGDVNLSNPSHEYHIIEDYGYDELGHPPATPYHVYFCRWIAGGQRQLSDKFSIKKRKFIGNTSMDPVLSFVMSNLGQVENGKLVCDPFVGTGGLLVSAAHFGGYVCGGDINYKIVHGRGKTSRAGGGWRDKDESIKYSLDQYGLVKHYVDVMVQDTAVDPWRKDKQLFDTIIADPPYGVREQCRKVGKRKTHEDPNAPPVHEVHFPEQTAYNLGDIFKDLLNFAYRTLMSGGRLVYWLPVYRPQYTDEIIPSHPGLKLICNCEQLLNHKTSRRLIVMEKQNTTEITSAEIKTNVYNEHNSFRNKYLKQKV